MKKFFLIGNWKAHGSQKGLKDFLEEFLATTPKENIASEGVETILAIPFPYLLFNEDNTLKASKAAIKIAAQTVSPFPEGAYTGEVTAKMLSDLGIRYTLIGHSERRTLRGESRHVLIDQLQQLEPYHIRPIICFGEAEQMPPQQTAVKLFTELQPLIQSLHPSQKEELLLAYEPYWAIGGTLSASSDRVFTILNYLGVQLESTFSIHPQFLYGGSINEDSIAQFLIPRANLNGFLVGKASLKGDAFSKLHQCIFNQLKQTPSGEGFL